MRRFLFAVLIALLLTGSSDAADSVPLSERPKLAAFIERWLVAQNAGRFEYYSALYHPSFSGVRRTGNKRRQLSRDLWLADRANMFKKPMKVSIEEVTVDEEKSHSSRSTIRFVQRWSSGSYGDVGRKVMRISGQGSSMAIDQEELLESVPEPMPAGRVEISATHKESIQTFLAALDEKNMVSFAKDFPRQEKDSTVLGVCSLSEALPIIAVFRPAVTLQVRPAAVSTADGCPKPAEDEDGDGQWNWPAVVEAKGAWPRITLMAWRYHGHQQGDFAREYILQLYLGVLRNAKGHILDLQTAKSGSDFAKLDGLTMEGSKATATETYIDSPCDGSDTHSFTEIQYSVVFQKNGEQLKIEEEKKDGASGACSDEEAQIYRNAGPPDEQSPE